ncbi:cobalamin-dependent protein [Candidatus Sumerlaeota bacterium]|nr:cobalamin-dependent protein [Candidatus Sumerlaeota bacterium]
MKWKSIFPKWRKLERQTCFHLPPHAPVVFAAEVPNDVELEFVDENVDPLDTSDSPDLVALSILLTAQLPRAYEIARAYRRRGIPVIAGGISATLHSEDLAKHVDSVFLGEVEGGRLAKVRDDLRAGDLKPLYDYHLDMPPIELVGTARRDILNRERYMYRGVRMLDLVHASRGCRFNCFPCCTPFLGGRRFRPRPIEKVVEEIESIDNGRLFLVDNSLAQDDRWVEELFRALIPLEKRWVSHPIACDDRLLELARQAGCWYVYQAIFDTSDVIRNRVRMYHDHDIAVEGTIILGTDDQDVDSIERLVDFLLEIGLDLAEFTIMTPFAHTPIRASLAKDGRLLTDDPSLYTCDRVVFQPKKMTPTELQDAYYGAWDTFYADASQELRMGDLFMKVLREEIASGRVERPPRRRSASADA